jgi:hypothetical protein
VVIHSSRADWRDKRYRNVHTACVAVALFLILAILEIDCTATN